MPKAQQARLGWLSAKSFGNREGRIRKGEPGYRISDSIAARIQNAISGGILAPGARLLAERELAQRLSASRESVREAYRSLEVAGLLVIRRGKDGGAFVRDVDHGAVTRSLSLMLRLGKTSHRELTEARLLIEPPVARLAAARATRSDIEALEAQIEGQMNAIRGSEDSRKYDLQFHRIMGECAKNLPLSILMNSMADLMIEALSGIEVSRDMRSHGVEFHRLLLDAIRRKDQDKAFKLMQQHVLETQKWVKRNRSKLHSRR